MPVTLLDIILIVVMLLSGLVGVGRGLLRGLVAVAGCAAAQTITSFIVVHDVSISSIIIFNLFFIGVLIGVLIVSARISHTFLNSRIGMVDRTFGFLFGLFRGLLVVTVAFVFFAWLIPDRSQPEWVRDAKSQVVLQGTGDWVMSMLPDDLDTAQGNQATSLEGHQATPLEEVFTSFGGVSGSIINGILLSLVIDFFAIVASWMGRTRPVDTLYPA
jgi:membrane protein required for colicin V production